MLTTIIKIKIFEYISFIEYQICLQKNNNNVEIVINSESKTNTIILS